MVAYGGATGSVHRPPAAATLAASYGLPAPPPLVRNAVPKFEASPVPTAYITHPSSLLHDMGPYHPECPDRLRAIGDRLIAAGLDSHLRPYEAPAATREQLARVH